MDIYNANEKPGSKFFKGFIPLTVLAVWVSALSFSTQQAGAAEMSFGTGNLIDGDFDLAFCVDAANVYGDLDLVAAASSGKQVAWWRNVPFTEVKLTAGDGTAGDDFGFSVSVDGNTIIVGAENDFEPGICSGSAYIYEKVGGVWAEVAKLTGTNILINRAIMPIARYRTSIRIAGGVCPHTVRLTL